MSKYRKKPVEIEAVKFNHEEWFLKKRGAYPMVTNDPLSMKPIILTLEGPMHVSDGDYIIKGVKGEFYPCKPDIFEETYDEVSLSKDTVPFQPITNKNGRANLTYKDGELIYEAGTIPDEERVKLTKQLVDEMDDGEMTNGISDGSHTFGDLYYQRMMLTSVIAKAIMSTKNLGTVRRSKLHDDGTMFKDYFIIYFTTPDGNFSYHYHMDNWDNFWFVPEVDKAIKWDGHSDLDVNRLLSVFPIEDYTQSGWK